MPRYTVLFDKRAQKQLYSLPKKEMIQMAAKLEALADNPRPAGCKKLVGREAYRIRQGNYRAIYTIEDEVLTVLVIEIGDRKEIYE